MATSTSKKFGGAALYKTKFQSSWQKAWPFITPIKDNQHAFHCTVCMKAVSCGHQGERDIAHHSESAQHQRNVKAMKNTRPLSQSFAPAINPLKDKVQ